MKTLFSAFMGFPAVWLLSALLHTIDPDVNGVSGLAAPTILLSVTLIALMLFLPGLLPLLAFHLGGNRGYWAALLVAASVVGYVIAEMGSGATDAQGWLVSFLGTTIICGVVFLLTTLPGVAALMRQRPASSLSA